MTKNSRICLFLLFAWLCGGSVYAQHPEDSTVCRPHQQPRKRWINNILNQAWNSIQRNPEDTCTNNPEAEVLHAKAEDPFMYYKGRVIRNIWITSLGFERSFTDTSSRVKSLSSRVARTLHVNTKDWVIRNNLFQKEGAKVDPYILADNERYLRTLDYLQDARIIVHADPNTEDSVDLEIITKDVFSIRLTLDNDGYSSLKARVSESNFLGMGQRIQGTVLAGQNRDPTVGYGVEYNKNNIGGSFIHLDLAYNNIDIGRSSGLELESSTSIVVARPLPSPYVHWAGGGEWSNNVALNSYHQPDSVWYPYAYEIRDAWAGYNLSLDHIMKHDSTIRDRKFLAVRYFRQHFTDGPAYFEQRFDPIYNNKEAVLGQLTFFRQEFIKTQYIYGFGITEDVPYGYNISLTSGWWKQNDLQRPYAGLTIDYYVASPQGSFCQYYLRTGTFVDGLRKLDDATLLVGASYFSKLFFSGTDFKIRQYIRGTYARIFNNLTYEPLRINNVYGLREFGSDSAEGIERISTQLETTFYTRYKPYGFRLAPFLYEEGALLRNAGEPITKAIFYPGFGGGLRTRNENIIFGTIEIKACFFPRYVVGQPAFKLLIASDLRYRYRTTYIHEPDIIRLNSDDW